MLRKANKQRFTVVVTVALVLACLPLKAQFLIQDSAPRPGASEKLSGGEIDWGNEFYYATGQAYLPTPNEEPDRGRAYLKARSDAKTRAVANLLTVIDATPVSFTTVAKDLIAREAALQRIIEERVSDVEIVGEKQQAIGSETAVLVTVRTPLYGARGIGSAIAKSRLQREDSPETPRTGLSVQRRNGAGAAVATASAAGPYTSLILDCLSTRIERAVTPRIRRADGTEVWTPGTPDLSAIQTHGVVTYARGLEEARRTPRAGGNPLFLRAAGRAGVRFLCDAVVSDADAQRILQENKTSRFLDKSDVILVVD